MQFRSFLHLPGSGMFQDNSVRSQEPAYLPQHFGEAIIDVAFDVPPD